MFLRSVPDRLLHRGELTIEDARAGNFREVTQQAGAQARQCIELVVDELFGGAGKAVGADQRRVLDVAFQPKIIGAARRTPRCGCRALSTSLDLLQRRTGGNQVGRLDLDVGSSKGDLLGACGFGADEADVPGVGAGGIGKLARLGETARILPERPRRSAIARAMSGDTPSGSPDGVLPVTSRKLLMLTPARRTPCGASSRTIDWDMRLGP